MKIIGLVTEYNPFHKGHLHHLLASKENTGASHTLAVMSGHFLQRGEPALLDKWSRAKAAVESGVDLVLELPTQFACSSAETFAFASVSLLNDLNIVDCLVFGSEAGDLKELDLIASTLNDPSVQFKETLKYNLDLGFSFPKARAIALEQELNISHDFQPNNVLGIEYLRALKKLNSPIQAETIQRIQADYMSKDLKGLIASATAIRNKLLHGQVKDIENFVTEETYTVLSKNKDNFVFTEDLGLLLLYKIRGMSVEDLRNIHDVSEGLEMKIKKAAQRASNYESLITLTLSKRYTRTRIQRIFVKILLNITKDTFQITKPLYARVLAFNTKGQEILNKLRKVSNIPLITNINKCDLNPEQQNQLNLDVLASDIYCLLNKNINHYKGGLDHTEMPRIIL